MSKKATTVRTRKCLRCGRPVVAEGGHKAVMCYGKYCDCNEEPKVEKTVDVIDGQQLFFPGMGPGETE